MPPKTPPPARMRAHGCLSSRQSAATLRGDEEGGATRPRCVLRHIYSLSSCFPPFFLPSLFKVFFTPSCGAAGDAETIATKIPTMHLGGEAEPSQGEPAGAERLKEVRETTKTPGRCCSRLALMSALLWKNVEGTETIHYRPVFS